MTTERQETLWHEFRVQRSPALKNELASSYRDLITAVVRKLLAGRYAGSSVIDVDDLEQVAYIGLLEAIERFDSTKGVKFETYAVRRIRGSIQDALREIDWVPRSVRKKARQTEKIRWQYQQQLHDHHRVQDDSAESLDEAYEVAMELQLGRIEPMDFTEGYLTEAGHRALTEEMNPQEVLEHGEVREQLIRSIERLGKRERLIITLYYFEALTFKEIAQILKISESRVSQIHETVLAHLRDQIAEFT